MLLLVGHADACTMGYTAHQLACTAMATNAIISTEDAEDMDKTS